jgi:hypothetical protein
MKIVEFQRDGNDVFAILESGNKVLLSWEYIFDKKPQVGDEFEVPEAPKAKKTKPVVE